MASAGRLSPFRLQRTRYTRLLGRGVLMANRWIVRITVWTAFLVTVVAAGPRAWRVVHARLQAIQARAPAATVEVGRVGFGRTPVWLRGELLLAVLEDIGPRLTGAPAAVRSAAAMRATDTVGLLDEAAARGLRERLLRSPWIRSVHLRRRYPDRFLVDAELRRPVLEALVGEGQPQVLVDGDGVCLPAVRVDALPRTQARAVDDAAALVGRIHPDARVRAAAAVAREWRDELRPLVPDAPALVEVDASNLGYAYLADRRWSEVCVGLARRDGGIAWFGYGHPPGTRLPRVAVQDKAVVMRAILAAVPGLAGLQSGDLRMTNRWRDWLRPRPPG